MPNRKYICIFVFLSQIGFSSVSLASTSDSIILNQKPLKRLGIGYTYSHLNPDFKNYIPVGLTFDYRLNRKWTVSAGAYFNYFTRSKSPTMVVAGFQAIDTLGRQPDGRPEATLKFETDFFKFLAFTSIKRSISEYKNFSIHQGFGFYFSHTDQTLNRKFYVTNEYYLNSNQWPTFGYFNQINSSSLFGANIFLEMVYSISKSFRLELVSSLILRSEKELARKSWRYYFIWEDQKRLKHPEYRTSQTSTNQNIKFLFFSNCSLKFYF